METRHKSIGHILAIFTVAVWGATFVSTKVLLRHFTAEEILFLRFFMGFLALWLVQPKIMKLQKKSHILYFVGAGLTGLVLYYLCENIALGYGDASLIGVIVSSAPLFSAIFSAIFLKEHIKAGFFVGFTVSMCGLIILSWTAQSTGVQFKGVILALIGAVSWSIYSVLTRKISLLGYPTFGSTRYIFLFGVLLMIPVAVFRGFRINAVLTMDIVSLANLMFLGFCASALCFVTWNFAVKQIGVVRTAVYIYASPVITVVLAAIVLGERMNRNQIIGTILVLSGLVLSEGRFLGRKEEQNV